MTIPSIIDEAEGLVHQLATELTRVHEGECLCCYVTRQLDQHGCDGTHRHALRWRDASAPRHRALVKRLGRLGACCCDCEILMNAYEPHPRLRTRKPVPDPDDAVIPAAVPPEKLPPCAGVGRGIVQPCDNWIRVRRW